jgi:dihydrofolate reductase
MSQQQVERKNINDIESPVVAEVTKLKQQERRDLLVFGHGLLGEILLKQHLLDVLDISIHPLFVGRGKLFFREGENAKLRLVATKSFSKGIVKLPMSRSTKWNSEPFVWLAIPKTCQDEKPRITYNLKRI